MSPTRAEIQGRIRAALEAGTLPRLRPRVMQANAEASPEEPVLLMRGCPTGVTCSACGLDGPVFTLRTPAVDAWFHLDCYHLWDEEVVRLHPGPP